MNYYCATNLLIVKKTGSEKNGERNNKGSVNRREWDKLAIGKSYNVDPLPIRTKYLITNNSVFYDFSSYAIKRIL